MDEEGWASSNGAVGVLAKVDKVNVNNKGIISSMSVTYEESGGDDKVSHPFVFRYDKNRVNLCFTAPPAAPLPYTIQKAVLPLDHQVAPSPADRLKAAAPAGLGKDDDADDPHDDGAGIDDHRELGATPTTACQFKRGDRVVRRGELCTVVTVDNSLSPPSLTLRKPDGNEVSTDADAVRLGHEAFAGDGEPVPSGRRCWSWGCMLSWCRGLLRAAVFAAFTAIALQLVLLPTAAATDATAAPVAAFSAYDHINNTAYTCATDGNNSSNSISNLLPSTGPADPVATMVGSALPALVGAGSLLRTVLAGRGLGRVTRPPQAQPPPSYISPFVKATAKGRADAIGPHDMITVMCIEAGGGAPSRMFELADTQQYDAIDLHVRKHYTLRMTLAEARARGVLESGVDHHFGDLVVLNNIEYLPSVRTWLESVRLFLQRTAKSKRGSRQQGCGFSYKAWKETEPRFGQYGEKNLQFSAHGSRKGLSAAEIRQLDGLLADGLRYQSAHVRTSPHLEAEYPAGGLRAALHSVALGARYGLARGVNVLEALTLALTKGGVNEGPECDELLHHVDSMNDDVDGYRWTTVIAMRSACGDRVVSIGYSRRACRSHCDQIARHRACEQKLIAEMKHYKETADSYDQPRNVDRCTGTTGSIAFEAAASVSGYLSCVASLVCDFEAIGLPVRRSVELLYAAAMCNSFERLYRAGIIYCWYVGTGVLPASTPFVGFFVQFARLHFGGNYQGGLQHAVRGQPIGNLLCRGDVDETCARLEHVLLSAATEKWTTDDLHRKLGETIMGLPSGGHLRASRILHVVGLTGLFPNFRTHATWARCQTRPLRLQSAKTLDESFPNMLPIKEQAKRKLAFKQAKAAGKKGLPAKLLLPQPDSWLAQCLLRLQAALGWVMTSIENGK